MDVQFPDYSHLFEVTQRRLKDLQKKVLKRNGNSIEQDKFMFLIIGNLNLRFNTINLLIYNKNYDGVFALQRTLFELQLSFEAYMESSEKDKFTELTGN